MEVTGGDIRSDRAQKDAKRFEKKKNIDKIIKEKIETTESEKNKSKIIDENEEKKT